MAKEFVVYCHWPTIMLLYHT